MIRNGKTLLLTFILLRRIFFHRSYNTVCSVIDSWEYVRRQPKYEETVGRALFIKLFELEPEAKAIFGFKGAALDDESFTKSLRFTRHAKYFIQMIDKALGMLGPDIELLTEILMELGVKHVAYGVKPEYFPRCVPFSP